ncbi:MAG TPA: esterase [Oceanospirillaceae bacterium]|nr:esterase [Oceanospirillaceae bacterium]
MTTPTEDNPVHLYNCGLQVRVSDLNYGNHLGNDAILSYFHEIRVQWLSHNQLSEQDVGGCGLIMTGANIDYLKQGHLHQKLTLSLSVSNIGKARFSLGYKLKEQKTGHPIATGSTHMGCFDYQRQKPARMPPGFAELLK